MAPIHFCRRSPHSHGNVPSDERPTETDEEQTDEPSGGAPDPADGAEVDSDDEASATSTDETEQRIGADPARDVFSSVESGPSTGGTEPATESDDRALSGETGMAFCRQCGERIAETATSCPNCGAPQDGGGSPTKKDPGIAAIASLVVPGAGQLYNGQFVRGIVAFVGVGVLDVLLVIVALVLSLLLIGPLFLLLIPVVHVLVAYDAYDQAQRINRGDVDPDA